MALGTLRSEEGPGPLEARLRRHRVKLVLLAALFLPIAVAMGVRDDKLVAALAMLASPTTVSSFVMARSMGHEGTLTASTVMLTTFFSILTLTLWLYLLRTLGLI